MLGPDDVIASVKFIPDKGNHAVAATVAGPLPDDTSVTFSLSMNIWGEAEPPIVGTWVVLGDLRFIAGKGWRAFRARYYRPSDGNGKS